MRHIYLAVIALPLLSSCGKSIPETSALNCFNTEFYQAGNSFTLANKLDGEYHATRKIRMYNNTSYLDEPAIKTLEVDHTGDETWAYQTSRVITIDSDNGQYLTHYEREAFDNRSAAVLARLSGRKPTGPQYTASRKMQPAKPTPFDLAQAGAQLTSEYSVDYTGEAGSATRNIQQTTLFKGMETVETPAGSFTTCHIQINRQASGDAATDEDNSEEHYWYAKDLGIPVKMSSNHDASAYLLIQADVAGQQFSAPAEILGAVGL